MLFWKRVLEGVTRYLYNDSRCHQSHRLCSLRPLFNSSTVLSSWNLLYVSCRSSSSTVSRLVLRPVRTALTDQIIVFVLPFRFIRQRYFWPRERQAPYFRDASLFEDIVIRCVRFAFANIPAKVGRVFFSKEVAHPFFRFRLLRHGYLKCPVHYQELNRHGVKGIWIASDPYVEPDVILYYCHGGGFSMGSSYFYLEFLIAWITCLKEAGYHNPACFALEYKLVPEAQWPTQFNEVQAGYKFLRESFGPESASKICVSGDSAGATLVLSMLLHPNPLGQDAQFDKMNRPGLAVLISPWTHLISELNQNTPSDYLNRESLHLYATQYGGRPALYDGVLSPGLSRGQWNKASPSGGYRITYGSEEVFAPGIEETVGHMKDNDASVKLHSRSAGIHAWPVVNLFLGATKDERLAGLKKVTEFVLTSNIEPRAKG